MLCLKGERYFYMKHNITERLFSVVFAVELNSSLVFGDVSFKSISQMGKQLTPWCTPVSQFNVSNRCLLSFLAKTKVVTLEKPPTTPKQKGIAAACSSLATPYYILQKHQSRNNNNNNNKLFETPQCSPLYTSQRHYYLYMQLAANEHFS